LLKVRALSHTNTQSASPRSDYQNRRENTENAVYKIKYIQFVLKILFYKKAAKINFKSH